MGVKIGDHDSARQAALDSYCIVDTPPEQAFDDIATIASRLCDTPVGLVSLIDRERQWFKAKVGLDDSETPRNIAFCDHAIRGDVAMVVPDARADPRFADNPLVTGEAQIRFYAGAPIIDEDGHALGTVCVIDTAPRADFTGADMPVALARQVALQLSLRRRILADEQSVAAAQNYREMLWSRAIDVMVVTDTDSHIIEANSAWEAMFGPVDPSLPISHYYAPGETQPALVPAEGEQGIHVQRRMVRADGQDVTIDWTLVRKNDLVFRIGRDQTRAIRAEEQLAHIQKMESLGQLTGGIAHDFNNLLTIILGNIETAQRRLAAGQGDGIERPLTHAREAGERAATLTQRLLAYARRQSLDPVTVDPAALVRDLSPLFERTLGDAHRVEVSVGADIRSIEIDPGQLENSLINLVVNARDAMPDGGAIAIDVANIDSAEDAPGPAGAAGRFVRIIVRDDGTGMDAATRKRLFEPFFTTKEPGRGTGLGLSQVMGFVSQSGGHVDVETGLGKGSAIALYLPVAGDDATSGRAASGDRSAAVAAPERARTETILLVDDNDRLRDHVAQLLGEQGYCVHEANDGLHATQALDALASPPDLVLSDIRMPNLDGFALSADVRRRYPHVPILLMTGYAGKEAPAHARHDAIIAKPFTVDRLLSQIDAMLARAAGR